MINAESEALHRPNAARWLRYAYGGRLPDQYRTWVLYDVTCRTWLLRHFARWTFLVALPASVAILLFLPTPWSVRALTATAVGGGLLMFSLVNVLIDTDRRAVRMGYSYNLPGQMRHERAVAQQRQGLQQRRDKSAARRDRGR